MATSTKSLKTLSHKASSRRWARVQKEANERKQRQLEKQADAERRRELRSEIAHLQRQRKNLKI